MAQPCFHCTPKLTTTSFLGDELLHRRRESQLHLHVNEWLIEPARERRSGRRQVWERWPHLHVNEWLIEPARERRSGRRQVWERWVSAVGDMSTLSNFSFSSVEEIEKRGLEERPEENRRSSSSFPAGIEKKTLVLDKCLLHLQGLPETELSPNSSKINLQTFPSPRKNPTPRNDAQEIPNEADWHQALQRRLDENIHARVLEQPSRSPRPRRPPVTHNFPAPVHRDMRAVRWFADKRNVAPKEHRDRRSRKGGR
ncbi:unnamed protein product [Caenorhabditis auriculariae]|uniref:Uncharacterized protein n=1 Tax=Caenorhabditis auriculariae TaxID=2777116 RepID=A0A8S1H019_9PELO|nr:unnamed protein product [Caenorhabditis auriculariae]